MQILARIIYSIKAELSRRLMRSHGAWSNYKGVVNVV